MSVRGTDLNFGFAKILRRVDGKSVSRRQLIQIVIEAEKVTELQAQRYVGRHIHQLKKKHLVRSEGPRNSTRYVFSEALLEVLIDPARAQDKKDDPSEVTTICASSLQHEKERLSAELKLAMGEVEAFQDYLGKFPEAKRVILDLLGQSRDSAALLYGKLNAIQKIIDATSAETTALC